MTLGTGLAVRHAWVDMMTMMDTTLSEHLNKPVPLGSQLVLAMAAAALAPMIVLISVGWAFFYDNTGTELSFQYWTFLVVVWVLGIAFLLARMLAGGFVRQLDGLARAAEGAAREASEVSTQRRSASNDFAALEEKFSHIEAVVAEGRAASLGRIRDLESEIEGLREAAELQAKFLSAVSHEIRTPLSAIVSAARIIQRYHETKPEVIERFGDTIVAEGNRLVRSITDMLDLVKIEAGSLIWSDDEMSPAAVASDVVRRVERTVRQHALELSVHVSEGLPTIYGDEQRIIQVLDNLLANAIKFTPRGGKIDLIVDVTDAGEVSFTVRDSGVGIADEELPHIFDKAWALQARKQSNHKQAGVGLGLALCREIVSRHGGELCAASRPGHGATFTVLLPVSLNRGLGAGGVAEADRRTRALLLMKKDVVADCAVRALRLEDMDARISSNLQEFFQMMTDWTPAVVVMSSSFAWNMNESTERRIRTAGVKHILLHSAPEGLVELTPPTNTEPVLAMLGRETPSGSTILLVEDDEEYGAVMEFELTQAGYSVLKAYNGVDAVEMAAARRPDGMVLDLALPQLDGFGVLDQLEARGLAMPTVVLTALDDPSLDTRLADMGALATFRKYELIESHDESAVGRVRDLLGPVLAAAASDVQGESAAVSAPASGGNGA